jgi:UDP-N-acetylglucosamine--N-acetylmuramyl-(pentapeptide) pyrophosphoryl-undecaprenol N-acetylglucosamine transferase
VSYRILFAGGGTGGHVIPALAVAEEMRRRGHEALFLGVERGMESRLVPQHDFPLRYLRVQGLNRVGLVNAVRSIALLPGSVISAANEIRAFNPHVIFSMGGYVSGPVMAAGRLSGTPMVIMEPNAYPGLTARWTARIVRKALVNFEETVAYFPPGIAQLTGVPVREAFFEMPQRTPSPPYTLFVTGGSQGSDALNSAMRDAWRHFASANVPVRILHQAGRMHAAEVATAFAATGLDGEVYSFIDDMPAIFAQADLVVGRSGAGAVAELAAARKPSILVPFPRAADQHQLKNAQVLAYAGAALLIEEAVLSGEHLATEVLRLFRDSAALSAMGSQAGAFARHGAAQSAADILEEEASSQ